MKTLADFGCPVWVFFVFRKTF